MIIFQGFSHLQTWIFSKSFLKSSNLKNSDFKEYFFRNIFSKTSRNTRSEIFKRRGSGPLSCNHTIFREPFSKRASVKRVTLKNQGE